VSKVIEPPLTADEYEELARAYYQTLPLEHFMEATPQANQRVIAVTALEQLKARRPDLQPFNELLIQYWIDDKLRRVVPDNMVRLCDQPLLTEGSFNIEIEPVAPLWVLEWVADSSEGKDYGDAFRKYERELKIPYCLSYHPGKNDFRFYRHNGKRYELVEVNDEGRYSLPELDLEIGLLEGWVRFWHLGELLEMPSEWQKRTDQLEAGLTAAKKEAANEKQLALQERTRAEQERTRADQAQQLAEAERQARLAVEAELAKLRARLGEDQTGSPSS